MRRGFLYLMAIKDGRGRWMDNVFIEHLWRSLEYECVYFHAFQLLNSMDPAPFRRRELDPAVVDNTVVIAEKAPVSADLGLAIRLDSAPSGANVEAIVADAVCENFRRMAAERRRALRRLFHDGRISLVIGISFVALSIAISEWLTGYFNRSNYARMIAETFVIGSWVAPWHPVNIFLFDWWTRRREARLYDRLTTMTVKVT